MAIPNKGSNPVHDFGICSPQTLSKNSSVQYNLCNNQSTTFSFTIICDQLQVHIRVIFKPFQRMSCSFTYHEYEIQCLYPPDLTDNAFCQSQKSIIAIIQHLYDTHFQRNAGYLFRFLENDLHSRKQWKQERKQPKGKQPNSSKTSGDLVWVSQEKPKNSATIQEIQNAYKEAHRKGKLNSPLVPRSWREETSSMPTWDPYNLPPHTLPQAVLDDQKLDSLDSCIQAVTKRIPLAEQWMPQIDAQRLTPKDLRTIICTACGSFPAGPLICVDSETSPILALASSFLQHADNLESQQKKTFPRSTLLARLIGFSIMRIYEALETDGSIKVDKKMAQYYPGQPSWQKTSRDLASFWNWMMAQLPGWKGRDIALYLLLTGEGGEKTLRKLFKRSLPAGVGELVGILNSEKYSITVSNSTTMPSIIELVNCLLGGLLGGYVDNTSICRALGCPDSYLDGSRIDWFKRLAIDKSSFAAQGLENSKTSTKRPRTIAFPDTSSENNTDEIQLNGNIEELDGETERGLSPALVSGDVQDVQGNSLFVVSPPSVMSNVLDGDGMDLDEFPFDFDLYAASTS